MTLLRKGLRFRQVRMLAGRPRRDTRSRRLGAQCPEAVSRLTPSVPRRASQLLAISRMQWQRPLSEVKGGNSRCERTGKVGVGRGGGKSKVVEVQVRMGEMGRVGRGTWKYPAVRRAVAGIRGVDADERAVTWRAVGNDRRSSIARRRLYQPWLQRLNRRERGLARGLIAGQSTSRLLEECLVCAVVLVREAALRVVWGSVSSRISVLAVLAPMPPPETMETT